MNAIEILKEELSDMPKTTLSKKELLDSMLADELNPKPCAGFRRQIQGWKWACGEGERAIADGANEWVIYEMLKRHLDVIVGHYATSELGIEAGSIGYEMCIAYWTALGAKVQGPEN